MPNRLEELRRQRTLIAEHLAWLDREISASAPAPVTSQAPAPPQVQATAEPISPPGTALPSAASPPSAQRTVVLGGKTITLRPEPPNLPEHDPANIKSDVRRGCLLYVTLATVALALGIGLLIWAARSTWFQQEASPYLTKALLVALVLGLAAGIHGLIARLRSK